MKGVGVGITRTTVDRLPGEISPAMQCSSCRSWSRAGRVGWIRHKDRCTNVDGNLVIRWFWLYRNMKFIGTVYVDKEGATDLFDRGYELREIPVKKVRTRVHNGP